MPANQLHPVYHSNACQQGSRTDIDRVLPADLDQADLEELIEKLSEPPKFRERFAPVSTIIGTEIVRGKNWTDMMMKAYRVFFRLLNSMGSYLHQASMEKFEERAMLPFSSISLDPDTLHQMIELDYEQGENSYGQLLELYKTGAIAPSITVPWHVLLPLLDNDFDRRLCIRVGLLMFWPDMKSYHDYLGTFGANTRFVVPFWLPECAYSRRTLEILVEEFLAIAKRDKIKDPHLVLLLDTVQVQPTDIDILMKSWDIVKVNDGVEVSVVFRDRSFSDWVTYSGPSVKKLIDRTIAKVDSELNEKGVDYCWGHFEELESLSFSTKSSMSYDQKITKLAQLSYLPLSPDMFIRRKMDGTYKNSPHEPQEVGLRDNTAWTDWHPSGNLGRWQGVLDSNAFFKLADENRPYMRRTRSGKIQEYGPQAWKYAFNQMRTTVTSQIKGDPETMHDGLLAILVKLSGAKDPVVARHNVSEFLAYWSHAHWREVFLQQDLSEADVDAQALADTYLFKDSKKKVTPKDYIKAAVAAQAYYFAIDSHRSFATAYENMDNRALYQSVVMLTLSLSSTIILCRWTGMEAEEKSFLKLLQEELFDFKSAFDRYDLPEYGLTRQEWEESLKSQVEESPLNVVERAARRVAARHLRPLGYKTEFTREDENLTTNTGHVWSTEIENSNYKWENKLFCGLREE